MQPSNATLIVGPGRIGSTLAIALHARGWPVSAITGRRPDRCAQLAGRLAPGILSGGPDALPGPYPVVILAVADDAIGSVAQELVSHRLVDAGSVALHLSGAHSSAVLEPVSATGADTGSMHPLQTFPDAETGVRSLPGSHWFLEGSAPALDVARRMVSLLEGIPHDIATGNKVLYHASASIASNFVTALMDAALQAAQAAGLDRREMLEALHPLVRAALDNTLEQDTAASLTGPISRGDIDTVRRHLDVIAGLDTLPELYRVLGRRCVHMARTERKIDGPTATALLRCLGDPQVGPGR